MHDALVVADDLTGANDTGNRFAERGFHTAVVAGSDAGAPSGADVSSPDEATPPDGATSPNEATPPDGATSPNEATPPDADVSASVLVVDTDSRYAPPGEAAARVAAAVETHPADVVYKKVDSTLRGNLVAEIDAAVEAAGADLAVVAPAFPGTGRTTAGGFHLVDGVPVAETDAGDDPDRPVESSRVPALFAASAHPVEHLPLDVVGDGPGAVRRALADAVETHGTALAVCDATRSRHLASVASGAAALDATPVFVGSGGLAGHVHLGGRGDAGGRGGRADEPRPAGVLGVVGSVSATALAQLDAVDEAALVRLDGTTAVTDADAAVRDAVDAAVAALAREGRAVVTAATGSDDVEATLAAAREAGVDGDEARDRVAEALGRVAAAVPERAPVRGFFLSGGAIAKRALDALDGRGVELTGRSVGTGVPLGTIDGGPADGAPVVTKAGAFGDGETIVNCLDFLAGYDA
jgi:uncharacterized protein YgbK (DUF1537 family)